MIIKYLVRTHEDNRLNYVKDKDDQIKLFDTFEEAWEQTDNALKGFVERIDLEEEFVIHDSTENDDDLLPSYKIYRIVNLYDILNEINRDRSEDWTDYDQHDFKEGLEEWTDWTLIGTLARI